MKYIKQECKTCAHYKVCSKITEFKALSVGLSNVKLTADGGFTIELKCDDYMSMGIFMRSDISPLTDGINTTPYTQRIDQYGSNPYDGLEVKYADCTSHDLKQN